MSTSSRQYSVKENARMRRKLRVRSRVRGTSDCPRLCVHRSLRNIYAQVIDDMTGTTLVSASTRDASVVEACEPGDSKSKRGYRVGVRIAELAKEKGIERIAFDRQGFLYHGRVKAVADGAREGGLKF